MTAEKKKKGNFLAILPRMSFSSSPQILRSFFSSFFPFSQNMKLQSVLDHKKELTNEKKLFMTHGKFSLTELFSVKFSSNEFLY
jgi:hypothetical protein